MSVYQTDTDITGAVFLATELIPIFQEHFGYQTDTDFPGSLGFLENRSV